MTACNPNRCPNRDNCPALALGRVFGDLIPPASSEKPKGCLAGPFQGPTRTTVSAGVEWLRSAVP
jgi:hypothetical protein